MEKNEKKAFVENTIIYGGLILSLVLLVSIVYFGIIKPAENMASSYQLQVAEVIIVKSEIQSIVIDDSVTGTFVLGIGTVSNKQYYVAYEIQEDGGLKLIQLDAEKTTIYQTLSENETPYVECYCNGFYTIKEIKLYVPENTIQRNYDLDL